ncbi:hypothetical protein B484DRAFT_60499, partial [Ochromonadaceae sp. CCMP2298]
GGRLRERPAADAAADAADARSAGTGAGTALRHVPAGRHAGGIRRHSGVRHVRADWGGGHAGAAGSRGGLRGGCGVRGGLRGGRERAPGLPAGTGGTGGGRCGGWAGAGGQLRGLQGAGGCAGSCGPQLPSLLGSQIPLSSQPPGLASWLLLGSG